MAVYVCLFVSRVGVVVSQPHNCQCGVSNCKCRRNICCGEFRNWCRCPFPTKVFAYGTVQYESDISQLEKLHTQGTQMYTKYLSGDALFNFFNWPALLRWDNKIDGMKRRCKGKLLATALRMKDKESQR